MYIFECDYVCMCVCVYFVWSMNQRLFNARTKQDHKESKRETQNVLFIIICMSITVKMTTTSEERINQEQERKLILSNVCYNCKLVSLSLKNFKFCGCCYIKTVSATEGNKCAKCDAVCRTNGIWVRKCSC